jgi:hypothetical protein
MKFLVLLAMAASCAGLALLPGVTPAATAATAARAAVSGSPQYTAKSAAAVAGYFANSIDVNFTHVQGREGGNGSDGDIGLLGTGSTNGAGIGMCDGSTGVAAQLGDVNLGGGMMNVDYGVGAFAGPAKNNGDLCQNGVVNPGGAVSLLGDIPSSHTVDISILFDGRHAHNGCHAGQVLFVAQDRSNPSNLKESPCIWLPRGTVFTEIDTGVVADTTLLSTPANVPLVTFAHLLASANLNDGAGTVHGSFQTDADWTVWPVVSTSNGTPQGSVLLTEGPFASDHYHLFSGSPVA